MAYGDSASMSGGDSSPAPKKKSSEKKSKPKSHGHWYSPSHLEHDVLHAGGVAASTTGGLIVNLAGDTKALSGIPEGMLHLTSSAGHDFRNLMLRGAPGVSTYNDPYQLPPIAKAEAKHYKQYYGPAFAGSALIVSGHPIAGGKKIAKFGHNFYEHPLQLPLDAAAVLSGGAGAAAKAGELAAAVAPVSRFGRLGASVAGLERAEPAVEAAVRDGDTAALAKLYARSKGPVVAKDGSAVFVPKTRVLQSLNNEALSHSMPVSRNAYNRGLTATIDAVKSKLPGASVRLDKKITRLNDAPHQTAFKRAIASVSAPFLKAAGEISKTERHGAMLRVQGVNTIEDAAALAAKDSERLAGAHEGGGYHPATIKRARRAHDFITSLLEGSQFRTLDDNALKDHIESFVGGVTRKGGGVEKSGRLKLHDRELQTHLYDVAREAMDAGDPSELVARLGEAAGRVPVHEFDKPYLQARLSQLQPGEKLHKAIVDPSEKQLKFERQLRDVSNKGSDLAVNELGLPAEAVEARRWMALRSIYGDAIPKGKQPVYIPHGMRSTHPAAQEIAKATTDLAGLTEHKANQLRKNLGINFANARYDTNPATVLNAHASVVRTVEHAKRLNTALDSIVSHKDLPEGAKIAGPRHDGWVDITKDPGLRRELALANQFIVDHAAAGTLVDPTLTKIHELAKTIADGTESRYMTKGQHEALVREVKKSAGAATRFYDKGMSLWKYQQLQYRPAWLVNNAMSQLALLATAHPLHGLPALAKVMTHPERRAELRAAAPEIFGEQGQGAAAALGDGAGPLASDLTSDAGRAKVAINAVAHKLDQGAKWSNKLNTRISDDLPRLAALDVRLTKDAQRFVDAHKHATGNEMSLQEAESHLLSEPSVVDHYAETVAHDLIDFSKMSEVERTTIRRWVPFWAWISRITMRTGQIAGEEPVKALVGTQLGELGERELDKQLGSHPSYMNGMKTIGKNRTHPGMFSTYGMNPFSTPADVVGQFGALGKRSSSPIVGGENPINQLSPFFTAALAAYANRDAFSGAQISTRWEPQSVYGRYGSQIVNGLPVARLYHAYEMARNPPATYTPLYQPGLRYAAASYMGFPFKRVNPGRMHSLGWADAAARGGY